MLKSKYSSDKYENVNLANLKILSTTRHSAISEQRLVDNDSVIQEIQLSNCATTDTSTWDSSPPALQMIENEPTAVNNEDVRESEITVEQQITVIMSIQYAQFSDISGAVECFLKEYQEKHNSNIPTLQLSAEPICSHCASTEVTHAEHIAQLSNWRKSLMG